MHLKNERNPSARARRRWLPSDDGTEPSLRNVDLADVRRPAPRYERGPRWDHPSRSPSALVFSLAVVATILLAFAALELAEWLFQ